MEGVRNGLLLWYERILPALLPFSVISYILVATNNLSFFSKILHPLIKRVIPVSPQGVYPLLAGFLFGFPLGSKIVSQLLETEQISIKEAQILLSVCNNISPVFITGYMVHQCIGNDRYMFPAIVCIYLPPLLFGSLQMRRTEKIDVHQKNAAPRSQITFKIMDAGIMNAFETLLKLCGYIVIFSILCQPLLFLQKRLPAFALGISGLLEITNGISFICNYSLKKTVMFLLCNTITAFGGLSGIAQTSSMIGDTSLSVKAYVRDKFLFSIGTLILSVLYLRCI
ncbi:MAG: hypothetical protein HFI37_05610 [Lachnospiraceae bacterium]|nr:hypothetical protein [Lachnospiraceae bacterium]